MIRLAQIQDLPAISRIYEEIFRAEEHAMPYTNWKRGVYPTEDTARTALEEGTLYVGEEDGFLWGVVILNDFQLPGYEQIPWSYPAAPEEVAVIHTLCIHPAFGGSGRARELIACCEDLSRSRGKTVIRLDTWVGNLPANRLYASIGYHFAGTGDFLFQGVLAEQLNCYERQL